MIGITFLTFLIIDAAPGNPMSHLIDPTISPEAIATRLQQLGMDRPMHMRYLTWLGQLFEGNFGYSIRYRRPVMELIYVRLWPTFLLSFSSLILSFVIAIPIGVLSATKQYSKLDYITSVFSMAGLSVPVFFLGIVLIKLLAYEIRLFPIGGMITLGAHHPDFFAYLFDFSKHPALLAYFLDVGRHLALPLLTLSYVGLASFVRYTRSSMLEVVRQDYIRTARAKGLNEKIVIYRHALRNALIPIITILGLSLPAIFSGAIITEAVFTWPGIGSLNIEAITFRDYPLLMGINFFLAVLIVLGNLLADLFYAIADPRIRFK